MAAILLLAAGAALWGAGSRERRLADAERALVTLRYEEATAAFDRVGQPGLFARWVPGLSSTADRDARGLVGYWTAAYDRAGRVDPLLAANAAYRAATRDGGDWRALVQRLDGVVERYATVLRNDPGHADAAWNYEFVVRYRAAIVARQQPVPPAEPDPGLTPHGLAGAPPAADTGTFKLIVPMRPDERREAEEAGRGRRRIKKG
jgi:hypothetical protein